MKRAFIIVFWAAGLSGQTIQDTAPRTLVNAPYAKLTAMPNGTVLYCTDCTATSPTSPGGMGVVVKRENGAWNGGGGGGGTTSAAPAGLTVTGAVYGVGESATLIESDSANRSDLSTGLYRKIKHSGSRTPGDNGNTYGILTQIGIFGGANYYDSSTPEVDKKTQGGETMLINFAGSGQKAGHGVTVANSGMGDSYGYDSVQYVDGHFDAAGDEVVGGQYRGYTVQQAAEFTGSITSATRPTCNTTTTAAITKSYTTTDFVTVPVVSTATCAAGDWITFANSQYLINGYTTTVAKINTVVDATHFTAIVQHQQPSGVTVTPCTRLVLAGMTTDYRDAGMLGQGRQAIITDGPTYTTGQIDGVVDSGSGYYRVTAKAGTGVNWTTGMVGGDANGIGLLCTDIDKWQTYSNNTAHACWPIQQLDGDSQHLRVYRYNGQMAASGGSYTYTIYPGARIEWLETTATSADLTMTAVIMRNNSFAWTPGKTFVQPLDPWLYVSYQHDAYCQIEGPIGNTAPCGTSYQALIGGKARGRAAFAAGGTSGDITHVDWDYGMSLAGNTGAGGIVIGGKDFADTGISLSNGNDLKKIRWQGGPTNNGVAEIYSINTGFVIDHLASKLRLSNAGTGEKITFDYSGVGLGNPTFTFPPRGGVINTGGPGLVSRALPAAVNDYVNIGSWTDTLTGGIHLDLSCTAGGQLSGTHWTADTYYNMTGGAWRLLGGEDSGGADPGDRYIAEISVAGFTNSVRLRRTANASGGQSLWCNVLAYGSSNAAFTASTTSGTETSPSTTYLAGSLVTQSSGTATINGKLALGSVAAYTCNAAVRGQFNYIAGGAGVKDIVQVCAKDGSDAYAWRPIY